MDGMGWDVRVGCEPCEGDLRGGRRAQVLRVYGRSVYVYVRWKSLEEWEPAHKVHTSLPTEQTSIRLFFFFGGQVGVGVSGVRGRAAGWASDQYADLGNVCMRACVFVRTPDFYEEVERAQEAGRHIHLDRPANFGIHHEYSLRAACSSSSLYQFSK